jgi:YVTN family beta-propeller protein
MLRPSLRSGTLLAVSAALSALFGLLTAPAVQGAPSAPSVQRITVGSFPTGVVMAGSGMGTAVVTNNGDGTVSFVDTRTGMPDTLLSLGAGSNPGAVEADYRGFAYVANDGPVVVVDVAGRTVLRRLVGTEGAFDIAVTRDGSRLYSDPGGTDTVTVVDPSTATIVHQLRIPGQVAGALALSPDGRTLYVATISAPPPNQEGTYAVFAFDTRTWQVLATVPLPLQALDLELTPNGRALYATVSINFQEPQPVVGNTVAVLDPRTLATTATITVGDVPTAISFTPNGRTAYVVNDYSNTVSVVATATGTVTATVPVGLAPSDVAVTRNGKAAYVTETGIGAEPGNTVAVLSGY